MVDSELLDLEDEVTKFVVSWVALQVHHVAWEDALSLTHEMLIMSQLRSNKSIVNGIVLGTRSEYSFLRINVQLSADDRGSN